MKCVVQNILPKLGGGSFCYPFTERMDVKDRGRCDNTADTRLRSAEGQERHPVAGVRTDMNHPDKASQSPAMRTPCPVVF